MRMTVNMRIFVSSVLQEHGRLEISWSTDDLDIEREYKYNHLLGFVKY